jgi:hypothetical protein
MLNAILRSLGVVLEPEDRERAREAFSLAVTHICFHEAEFAHVQSRTLSTRLAHLVIRLAGKNPKDDPEKLSQQALSVLRYDGLGDIPNVSGVAPATPDAPPPAKDAEGANTCCGCG